MIVIKSHSQTCIPYIHCVCSEISKTKNRYFWNIYNILLFFYTHDTINTGSLWGGSIGRQGFPSQKVTNAEHWWVFVAVIPKRQLKEHPRGAGTCVWLQWHQQIYQALKIKMFAEGWVVYPRTSGSPEPTWQEARSAECQVGYGDRRGLGYTTQPSANILIFYYCPCFTIDLYNLRCVRPQNTTETGPRPHNQLSMSSCRRWRHSNQWEASGGDPVMLLINYNAISDIIQIALELTHDVKHCIYCRQNVFQMDKWNGRS